MPSPKIIADLRLQLAAKTAVGATSATLASDVDSDGTALPTGTYYFTIDSGNSNKEYISCTKTGTALTSIKTVSRQGIETSGMLYAHNVAAPVIMTDFATYKSYIDEATIAGISPATTTTLGGVNTTTNTASSVVVSTDDARVPTQGENDALAGTSGTPSSSNKYVTNDDATARLALKAGIKFGGTGADGALAITSGATNIDLGSAQTVIKNYTSISITGTASLTFTNPHANGTTVILKSQGEVTLTSSAAPMIVASGIGAAASTSGYGFSIVKTNTGTAGAQHYNACTGGIVPNLTTNYIRSVISGKYPHLVPGAGGLTSPGTAGGSGGGSAINTGSDSTSGSNNGPTGSGTGGRGGGVLIIECGGALNFTTASGISVAGVIGGSGSGSYGGGGGGGGGGICVITYNSVTANTGTITVAGGAGGPTGTPNIGGGAGGAGGNGYSLVAANTEFA